jgi:hypothetical protein
VNLPTLDDSNNSSEGNTPGAKPKVCTFLRTKTAFGSYMMETDDAEEAPAWQDGNSTTAIFWCLKTMDTCGPDDDFAHAKTCRPGRECFRSDDD